MTRFSLFIRWCLFVVSLSAAVLAPSRSSADMPDGASLVDYGFKGFSVGAELGLALGYISTGPVYRQQEWKKLVVGLGVGALVGMATGIVVAVTDATGSGVPMGYFILRDAGYGTLIGATMGAVVGMLLWVDDGTSKDVLKGAAFGALFGSAAGIAYGVVEGANATPVRERAALRLGDGWNLSVSPAPIDRGPGLALQLAHPIDF